MKSFILTTLLLALTCAPSRAQFNLPSSSTDNNRYPRYPAQSNSFGTSNPNSIDGGLSASRYPATQSLSAGSPAAGLGASPVTASTPGNPNARIFGLFGGGGRGGRGGGLFSNLLGALTGANRNPIEDGRGGAYPYPVPAPFPAYQPYGIPPPYAGGFGYPGFGGGYGNGYFG